MDISLAASRNSILSAVVSQCTDIEKLLNSYKQTLLRAVKRATNLAGSFPASWIAINKRLWANVMTCFVKQRSASMVFVLGKICMKDELA